MPAWFTRARHPGLPPVVMPVEGVEHYPGWIAYGEKSVDIDALNVALFREQQATDPAFAPPVAQVHAPVAPVVAAPAVAPVMPAPAVPVSPAPAGAAPKEQ